LRKAISDDPLDRFHALGKASVRWAAGSPTYFRIISDRSLIDFESAPARSQRGRDRPRGGQGPLQHSFLGSSARAQELGFTQVRTIDDDLGRSGSGLVDRPGFARLVAMVCKVGAVLSLEASRLARNGRDWHPLIELCGFSGALVIDAECVYDPRLSNDRLLLGLKGTMSEFELSLFRQR